MAQIKQDIAAVAAALADKPEVENLNRIISYLKYLETMCDNAHEALQAVLSSGVILDPDCLEMVRLGLNNQPQLPTTRLS